MAALRKPTTYAFLLVWTFVCLFPIFWTVTTSFKAAKDIYQREIIPWLQYQPIWKGWQSIGLSPSTIGEPSSPRDQFLKYASNTVTISLSAALLAAIIGSLAAYGLSRFAYRFGPWRNKDISFWFL